MSSERIKEPMVMQMQTEVKSNINRPIHNVVKGDLYRRYIKQIFDFFLSLCALILLSPLFLFLTLLGWIKMKGNPFFTQERAGKHEKIFKLVKFRTMTNEKDKNGELLPDEVRLNKYGKFLRSTSLDELPELLNIFIGHMSLVGPRPLLVQYLPYYTSEEKHRHDVRPGLTGLAQVNGRSFISWEEIFAYDLHYVNNMTLDMDIRIIWDTAGKILGRNNIADVTLAKKGNDNQFYFVVDGKNVVLHRPLSIEREEMISAK